MLELSAPIHTIFILIGIVVIIAIVAGYLFVSERNFRQKAEAIADKTKKLLEQLGDLFKPNKRVTQEEIDKLLSENKDTIDAARDISQTKDRNKETLRTTGILDFVEQTREENLQERLRENNATYDAIRQLAEVYDEPLKTFESLIAPNHYFTYSEMERFENSLKELEVY